LGFLWQQREERGTEERSVRGDTKDLLYTPISIKVVAAESNKSRPPANNVLIS
jgi:hypothetical protein